MRTTARKLKLWNGRWGNKQAHIYVAAYSQKDILVLFKELFGRNMVTLSEIKNFWSAGHWGTAMRGIAPSRGAWITETSLSAPVKVEAKPKPKKVHPENCVCIECNLAKRVLHLPGCICANCKEGITRSSRMERL